MNTHKQITLFRNVKIIDGVTSLLKIQYEISPVKKRGRPKKSNTSNKEKKIRKLEGCNTNLLHQMSRTINFFKF